MRLLLYIFSVLLLSPLSFKAQSFLQFYPGQQTPNPNIYVGSNPTCLETTNDGGFFIGGYMADPDSTFIVKMQLRKIDNLGNEIWNVKDYDFGFDRITDLVSFGDTAIYCAADFSNDIGIVKRNVNGVKVWTKTFAQFHDSCAGITALIRTKDNNIALCGNVVGWQCSPDNTDVFVAKYDRVGNEIWSKVFEIPEANYAFDIIENDDSTFFLTGSTYQLDSFSGFTHTQTILWKLTADGDTVWTKKYGIHNEEGFAITHLPNNKIAICGREAGIANPPGDNANYKILSDSGEVLFEFIDSLAYDNYFTSIRANDEFVYLVESNSRGPSNDSFNDINILKFSAQTNEAVFVKTFGLPGTQDPVDAQLLSENRLAITFFESSLSCLGCTGLVLLDSTGCVIEWCYTSVPEVNPKQPFTTVYPNPFTDYIVVAGNEKSKVAFFDNYGRRILEQTIDYGNQLISFGYLPDGIYFLQVNGIESKTFKLIRSPN